MLHQTNSHQIPGFSKAAFMVRGDIPKRKKWLLIWDWGIIYIRNKKQKEKKKKKKPLPRELPVASVILLENNIIKGKSLERCEWDMNF